MNHHVAFALVSVSALIPGCSTGISANPGAVSGPTASMWLEFTVGQDGGPKEIKVASYRGPEEQKVAIEKAAIDGVKAYYKSRSSPGTVVRLEIDLPLSDYPAREVNHSTDPTPASGTSPTGQEPLRR
jgi:hypothetical protein